MDMYKTEDSAINSVYGLAATDSPATFGIDEKHIHKFHDVYVHSHEDEIRQIDILQEECAELIQALSKMKRICDETQEHGHDAIKYINARKHLVEEMTHVAISSAVVGIQFYISQGEITLEVQRKDNYLERIEED